MEKLTAEEMLEHIVTWVDSLTPDMITQEALTEIRHILYERHLVEERRWK